MQLVLLFTEKLAGDIVSSYAVQDKTQVAEIDPSMFLEVPDEENEDELCQECGEADNEEILMYCDGCGKLWHTYCVDLDDVPHAAWFCDKCSEDRATDPQLRYGSRRRSAVGRRRTRAMERRRRNHNATQDDGWNQVWQTVWSRLSLDLDFPFDDDENPATIMRRHRAAVEAQRREHEAWERRMRVAELVGAGNRFRETESTLLDNDNSRHAGPTAPPPESAEEVAAWDAFAEAQHEQARPESSNNRRRKRKSRTSSPPNHSAPESPVREVKRQRSNPPVRAQRRVPVQARSSPVRRPLPQTRPHTVTESAGPSFLQSLLQEVEVSAGPANIALHRSSPRYPASPPAEQHSPRPSSPATSNPSSPRALSATPPPPMNSFRPSSPPGLSSTILPVYPPTISPRSASPSGYSPQRSTSPEPKEKTSEALKKLNVAGAPPAPNIARPKPQRPRIPFSTNGVPARSNEATPTRAGLTADNKAGVQKLVSAALKPHYHEQKISKDEYTAINRDVSRMLYDKIIDFEALDLDGKTRWERVAGEEVNKAIAALKA